MLIDHIQSVWVLSWRNFTNPTARTVPLAQAFGLPARRPGLSCGRSTSSQLIGEAEKQLTLVLRLDAALHSLGIVTLIIQKLAVIGARGVLQKEETSNPSRFGNSVECELAATLMRSPHREVLLVLKARSQVREQLRH